MPYVIPTVAELKARYPEFTDVSDTVIQYAIAEASRSVDNGWFEEDYQPAIMALAAHLMVTDGELGGDTAIVGYVTSSKLGDAQDTYSGVTGLEAGSTYAGTVYGRRYARLLAVNAQGVVLL